MKKAYATPALVMSGSTIRETLVGGNAGSEIQGLKPTGGGTVGFYL